MERKSSIENVLDAVSPEDVELGEHTSPDGAVTILFTDIEGSTGMVERMGDERWIEILHEHNALIRERVESYGGTEVKNQGDGFMLAFTSSRAALHCAIEIQRAFRQWCEERPEEPIRVRIGLHSGFMIQEGIDYFGRNVILAARIADRARGGEILVSEQLRDYTATDGSFRFHDPQDLSLKGLTGTHRVHPVDWAAA